MAENTTQTKHLTSLDFDIDKIPNQLESISKMVDSYAEQIQESFNKKVQFNPFSGLDASVGTNTVDQARKSIKGLSNDIDNAFKDMTQEQSIVSQMFSEKDINDAKKRLTDLLSTVGRISSVRINTDEANRTLSATVTTIGNSGEKISETFRYVKEPIDDATDSMEKMDRVWKKTSSTISENLEQQRKQYDRLLTYLDKQIERQKDLTTKYSVKTGDSSELTRQSKELENQLETLREQLSENKKITDEVNRRTDDYIKQSREIERTYKASQNQPKVQNSFLSTIDAAKFTVVQEGLDLIQEGVVNTFQTLKSVEDQVVEITRVFSDANVNMEQFTDDMFTLSTSYGRTFEDAGEVVLRFAQAGYDISDSLKMAESTMLALNTAELDVENSTNSLISIMRQWKMETEEFPLLIDKINYTADNYATTSQDLVDGLLRVSSAAKNAGITFDENIGLLTAMQETSGRTGKEIGTALNSLITFTQKAQTDGTLEGMGISIFADAAQTELRSVMSIWEELSEKVKSGGTDFVDSLMKQLDMTDLMSEQVAEYAGLTEELAQIQELEHQMNEQNISDMEKQEIYELGKTYRRNYFIALLENFNSVQDIANDLQNAEGHSMQENSKYMDTLTAKYNQFIGSLRELAQQAGENGLLDLSKGVLELATNFNQFLKSVGGAETALKVILGIIIQLNAVKIAKWGSDLKDTLGISILYLGDFAKAMMNAEGAAGKLSVVGGALSKINWAGWIGIATTAFGLLSGAIIKAREEEEKFRKEIISGAQEDQERVDTLTELQGKYNQLVSVQGRTAEQEQELKEVSEQIEEQLKGRTTALDNLTAGSKEYTEALQKQIEAERERLRVSLENARVASEEQLSESAKNDLGFGTTLGFNLPIDDLVEANGQLTEMGENLKEILDIDVGGKTRGALQMSTGFVGINTDDLDTSADAILKYYDQIKRLQEAEDERIEDLPAKERAEEVEREGYRNLVEEVQRLEDELGVLETAQSRLAVAFNDFNGVLPETEAGFDAFIDGILESTGLGESFRDVAEDMAKDVFPELADAIKETSIATNEFEEAAKTAEQELANMKSHMENLSNIDSAYNSLADAVSEYNSTGQLSISTLQQLLSLEPQYLQYLVNENGQLAINSEGFLRLANAELDEMEIAEKRMLLNTIKSFQSEAEAQAWLAAQTETTTEKLAGLNAELANTIAALATTKGWSDETVQSFANMANAISSAFNATRSSMQDTFTSMPTYTAQTASAASTVTKSFYDQETEMFERLNRMGQKTTQEVVDFYREMTKSAKLSASERLDAEEKLFDAIKRQLQEAKEAQLDYYNDLKDKIEANADAEIDRLESQRDSIEASYDSQREALEDQKEAIEDAADAQLDALDRVEKAKDRARERDEYYRDREDILQDIDSASRRSGIDARRDEAEARERLEELDREYQEKLEDYEIEDQREAIEANKEAQLAAIEEQMEALEEWRDSSIEDIEASIDAVEAQKEAQLAAIDEQIAALNEAFSEEQINMLAYQAMTNEELYNQYYNQFIEPMSQGMYDGFVAASDAMTDAAASSASNMLAAYEANLIAPLSNELASVGSMLDAYMNQMNEMSNSIVPPMDGQWFIGHGGPGSGSGNLPTYDNRSVNIRNYNTISDALSGRLTENRIVKSITDKFYAR